MPERICSPPRSDWDLLVPQLTTGEREVAEFFYSHLEPDWEIYLQPWLNGIHPDLVLLHPDRGVAVFEVKDWDPVRGRYFVDDTSGRRVLKGHFPGKDRPVPLRGRDNPFEQVYDYKEFLSDICLSFAGKRGYGRIMAGVIFTQGDPAYWERLAIAFRGNVDYPAKWPVIGRDVFDPGSRGRVFLDGGLSRSNLMTPELADILSPNPPKG